MYWDKEASAHAFTRLDEVDATVRSYLKDLLDAYHGEARPQRYYDILAGYWLQSVSHAVLVAMNSPHDPNAPAPACNSLPVFRTDIEFIDHVSRSDNFHSNLRALLEARDDAGVGFDSQTAAFESSPAAAGGFIRRWVKRVMGKIGNREAILVCHPYAKCSALTWLRFVVQARKVMCWDDLDAYAQFPEPVAVAIDRDWRLARLKSARGNADSLIEAIKRLLPLFIPVAFLEGFRQLRRAALRVPIGRPRGFYTASALYNQLLFKLLAAEHQQSTLLLGHQHGGSYGMELRHAPEEFERSVCDFFYTWGWEGGSAETRALSPPAFKSSARRKRWSLMLCLADFPRTNYRVQFFPAAEAAEQTIRETLAFARNPSLALAQRILIRPFPANYGRGWPDELRQALPTAQMDRYEKKAIERFAESELVFHNYISTGWLESIWLDVPTLALYDPAVYAFRADALPHVETLERFGLLHRSGASAAERFAAVRDDLQGWWNQAEFRAARAHFAARYVRVSTDWQQEWIAEFAWVLRNQQSIAARRAPAAGAPDRSRIYRPLPGH